MGSPYPTLIEEYDPARHAHSFAPVLLATRAPTTRPVPHCRYFLENLPRFLDAPGEYYFVQQGPLAGRLYVRLPREQDPNGVAIEVAERLTHRRYPRAEPHPCLRAYFPLPEHPIALCCAPRSAHENGPTSIPPV